MAIFSEFRSFIARGNVVDLAVGVVIGAAFGRIISSLVSDIIMPPLGWAMSGIDFSNLYLNLSNTAYSSLAAAKAAGAPTINYGLFLNSLLDFLIIAFVLFLVIRQINRMSTPPAPAATPEDIKLLTEIRDLLRAQQTGLGGGSTHGEGRNL